MPLRDELVVTSPLLTAPGALRASMQLEKEGGNVNDK
jgi:hypothetical protein